MCIYIYTHIYIYIYTYTHMYEYISGDPGRPPGHADAVADRSQRGLDRYVDKANKYIYIYIYIYI